MLDQLIARIRAGGTLETGGLARELGASPALVEAMLEHLQRQGLIDCYEDRGSACKGCGMRSACGASNGVGARLWQGPRPLR